MSTAIGIKTATFKRPTVAGEHCNTKMSVFNDNGEYVISINRRIFVNGNNYDENECKVVRKVKDKTVIEQRMAFRIDTLEAIVAWAKHTIKEYEKQT